MTIGCSSLNDPQVVWCADNYGAVRDSAIRLGISLPETSDNWWTDSGAIRACKAAFASR